MNEENGIADIISEVKQFHGVEVKKITLDGKQIDVAVLPTGKTLKSVKPLFDEYRDKPERRTGTAALYDLSSFIAYVNRFKDEDSAIFANNDINNPSLTGIIDYHKAGYDGDPRYCMHKAVYNFPLSKEWQAWLNYDGQSFTQSDFAAFLEDRIGDVVHPSDGDESANEELEKLSALLGGNFASPNKLFSLSKELHVNEEVRVKNSVNLSSGESKIIYETEHRDESGMPIEVPNMFLIVVPVFETGDLYRVAVRLRYKVRDGKITWFYNLYRIENTFDNAFDGACKTAKEETGLPLYVGSSER
jgi:uncharacterized protein YfdQ (DUF2303 family)